ncbi:hypothetical protein H4O18_08025 [Arenibacter sp. BSSL-BM3]|uniref:Uncharacterized protein n=1 Tax=Arenibacter arenosicollis TaxID=2762274 RepID=A0ABR7QL64_9FLAO|nr:hypothetical protein [Arenibacter arenosicollis]MBC8767935.1 hypothetical protein [Arenibacter arenosicollis]
MSGSIQDMNNRVNQNRSLKPSNRARFKENNRDNIYSDSEPSPTKLTFKKISEIELKKIKERIKNKALKDRTRETYIFIFLVAALLGLLILLIK